MREKLQEFEEKRLRFNAVFERYGSKIGWNGCSQKTILLKNVCLDDTEVTDHIWFMETKGFKTIGELYCGETVEFNARVKIYKKGYWGNNWEKQVDNPPGFDYKLSYPSKIAKHINLK